MPPATEPASQKETTRVEAFSDGVFAIAITLLVLDLKVPRAHPPDEDLLGFLRSQWPTYAAFLSSFTTIGIMWLNHHRLFNLIGKVDTPLMIYNGLLLLGVTLTPWPTALVAEYHGRPAETLAALVYTGLFTGIAVSFNLLWWHAHRWGGLLLRTADATKVRGITIAYSFGPPMYLLSCWLATHNLQAMLGMVTGLALFWCVPAEAIFGRRGLFPPS